MDIIPIPKMKFVFEKDSKLQETIFTIYKTAKPFYDENKDIIISGTIIDYANNYFKKELPNLSIEESLDYLGYLTKDNYKSNVIIDLLSKELIKNGYNVYIDNTDIIINNTFGLTKKSTIILYKKQDNGGKKKLYHFISDDFNMQELLFFINHFSKS